MDIWIGFILHAINVPPTPTYYILSQVINYYAVFF